MDITYIIIGIVLLVILVFIIIKEYVDYNKRLRKAYELSKQAFGKLSTKRLSLDELAASKKMFYRYQTENSIDDITASDLSLDDVFERLDVSLSAPGSQYFYNLLRTPKKNREELQNFIDKVNYFEDNPDACHEIRKHFLAIGRMFRVSFFDYLDLFPSVENKRLIKEYFVVLSVFIGIGVLFFFTPVGIALLILSVCYNIIDYYKERGEIESYIIALSYIIRFINKSGEIAKNSIPVLKEEFNALSLLYSDLKPLTKGSYLVLCRNKDLGSGNPLDMILDYLRMLFHLDIIRFYYMLSGIQKHTEQLEEMYVLLGKIETYVTSASIRLAFPNHCIPGYSDNLIAKDMYHPLISEPVLNSVSTNRCILLTGSNASGKSTFLKTVAINYLFSKTVGIAFAKEFSSDFYQMFSSMSLRDDIVNKDSYFMVEIKALKRIFDYNNRHKNEKILCFVDEVLRGTNTVERIAACTQILRNMSDCGFLCFAATHDIELTNLLENNFSNYHFDEDIVENDVLFSYCLKEGKATSKNALKLLSIMGFDGEIVDRAKTMADDFCEDGIWKG